MSTKRAERPLDWWKVLALSLAGTWVLTLGLVLTPPTAGSQTKDWERPAWGKDSFPHVDKAQEYLTKAKNEVIRGPRSSGGHRTPAVNHINAAIFELEQGKAYALGDHMGW